MGSTIQTTLEGASTVYQAMPEISQYTTSVQEGEATTKPGGVSYEVVLEEAKTNDKPTITSPATPALSVEEIEKKLKEVELRRKSMEASTLEKLAEKEKKAEEVRAKKANMTPVEGEKE